MAEVAFDSDRKRIWEVDCDSIKSVRAGVGWSRDFLIPGR